MGGKGSGGHPRSGRRPGIDEITVRLIGRQFTKIYKALVRRAAYQANKREIAGRRDGLIFENLKIIHVDTAGDGAEDRSPRARSWVIDRIKQRGVV